MWEYVFGGATIFGTIVGLFSVYNGGATRRHRAELIKEIRDSISELIKEEPRLTCELIVKVSEHHGS